MHTTRVPKCIKEIMVVNCKRSQVPFWHLNSLEGANMNMTVSDFLKMHRLLKFLFVYK